MTTAVPLAYHVDGRVGAPVLVLLNSMGTTTAMWDRQIDHLTPALRVVRADTRGHGASPAGGDSCTIDDLGGDVLLLLDRLETELGVGRVHLAGLSLGGMVAMWIAAAAPRRVDRLALLCTAAWLPPAEAWRERAATVRESGMETVASTVVNRWFTPAMQSREPEVVAAYRDMLCGVDKSQYAACCDAVAGMDIRGRLTHITAPTLVIAGAEDPVIPLDRARGLARAVAGSRIEVLDHAAHLANVERPEEVSRLLVQHLGGESPRVR